MCLKSLGYFTKPHITLKSLKFSENIFKMPRVLKKKLRIRKKKASWQLPNCHIGQSAPGSAWLRAFGFVRRFE
jgi:hypothetical protein